MVDENNPDYGMHANDTKDTSVKKPVGSIKPRQRTVAKKSAQPSGRSVTEKGKILARIAESISGGKLTLKKALQEAGISKRTFYTWKRNAPSDEVPVTETKELGLAEEIVHLEAENKRYRRMLADKLRAENAELRRRLAS